MLIKEKTKPEIESKIGSMGDFLKMEYLEECLKQNFSFDIKKFCSEELAKLYELRNMFSEAARKLEFIGEICLTFRERKEAYMKAAEFFVKAGLYDKAEYSLKKAIESGNDLEKKELKKAIDELLRQQAEVYEKENRIGKALKAYEYFYKICDESEKEQVKEKLLVIYQKLVMISEYNILKGN